MIFLKEFLVKNRKFLKRKAFAVGVNYSNTSIVFYLILNTFYHEIF